MKPNCCIFTELGGWCSLGNAPCDSFENCQEANREAARCVNCGLTLTDEEKAEGKVCLACNADILNLLKEV